MEQDGHDFHPDTIDTFIESNMEASVAPKPLHEHLIFNGVNWEERRTAADMLSQQRNRGKAIAVKSGLLLGNSLERSF